MEDLTRTASAETVTMSLFNCFGLVLGIKDESVRRRER